MREIPSAGTNVDTTHARLPHLDDRIAVHHMRTTAHNHRMSRMYLTPRARAQEPIHLSLEESQVVERRCAVGVGEEDTFAAGEEDALAEGEYSQRFLGSRLGVSRSCTQDLF